MTRARTVAAEILSKRQDKSIYRSLTGSRRDQVFAFHKLYECPIHEGTVTTTIDHMSTDRIALRLNLILEEVQELLRDGFGVESKIYFCGIGNDITEYSDKLSTALEENGYFNIVEATDALGDLSYVIDGFALELGVNLDAAIDEIHASNMTKLGEDGNPIYREDGKVLKGPYFTEPNLTEVIFNK